MTILLWILLTLVVFTFIVFIHEMGHFLTARFTKMKVEEFGIGIPPKAKSLGRDKKWTEYTLNWLPIGGFVRIKWEDPGSEEANDIDAFSSKKWWARSLVLIAWVTMNFILALVIIFWFFMTGTSPISPNVFLENDYGSYLLPSFKNALETGYIEHDGIILSPLSGSIAENAGILPWDILESLNGGKIKDMDILRENIWRWWTLEFIVSGTGGSRTIEITPENGKIGTYLGYKNIKLNGNYSKNFTFKESVKWSLYETYALSRTTLDVLWSTLRKLISPVTPEERKEATEMLSGPIGIGSGFIDIIEFGITWKIILSIIALLSINLWVLNILPFPALDGGRLVSTTIRSIIGLFYHKNRILNKIEYFIHAFGMIFLLWLSLLVALLDVYKIF